jgi:hypothetical protein
MITKLLLLAGVLLLGGCATVKPVPLEMSVIDRPALNTVHKQEIGNSLLEYYVSRTMPSIRILESFNVARRTYQPQTPRPMGTGDKISRFLIEHETGDPQLTMNVCFDPSDSVFFMPNGYGICDFIIKGLHNSGPVRTTPEKYVDVRQPQFRQELIYNGKVGNSVKFLYREFHGDTMRAPFSQEVQYDLQEGKTIGFKGARLEVLTSTNRLIEYRVLKNFDR